MNTQLSISLGMETLKNSINNETSIDLVVGQSYYYISQQRPKKFTLKRVKMIVTIDQDEQKPIITTSAVGTLPGNKVVLVPLSSIYRSRAEILVHLSTIPTASFINHSIQTTNVSSK